MTGRRRSIRVKIFAILLIPATAVMVIWGFAATITVQGGLELLKISTVYENLVVPTAATIVELQQERSKSAAFLGNPVAFRADLDEQRRRTDNQIKRLTEISVAAQADTPTVMWERRQKLLRKAHELEDLRTRVDNQDISRLGAIQNYSDIVEVAYRVYDQMVLSPDVDLVGQIKAIVLVDRAREAMSQEVALITGAVSAGRLSQPELDAFSSMVSKRRLLFQLGGDQLDPEMVQLHTRLATSPEYAAFTALEDQIVKVPANRPLPTDAALWHATGETMVSGFASLNSEISDKIAGRGEPLARDVLYRIAIAGVLGVLSLAATVFISFAFARRLSAELVALEQAASDLADQRLPRIVERLRRGDDVDVTAETPPMPVSGDTLEVHNVERAFTSVQHTAIEAAVGQAELRKGIGKVFLNLARRSQSLLQRQLSMLDGLEQQVTDPDVLDKLFGIDHLTTRMRRHAEGLIILSGAAPARGWRNPVSLFDIVRAAVEEVEDYLRVNVAVPHGPALVGGTVTDVIHLVAELVENATIFSPPHTQVFVRGEPVARGFALEIEDRGLGINRWEMAQLNERLANPPEFDLADSDRLGLFVVGRLARRHGIKVSLRPSPYGGTSAIMLIPQEILVESNETEYSVERLPTTEPAAAFALTSVSGDDDGLPKRVRQANLAPQLREEPRDLFSSFQAGRQQAEEES